ncbi:PspC domain-containing protein [Spirosoma sordidisoli]|uniref:PspC domain-containing protein n=1 Tax=Spirosoma sordidisoli TaxID=2502893 RepID=A0A4Q2UN48_9BACT|nr:PspC domain-containing protein [Spirosoma sordidisoli]RYC71073.1 PspC domain-containing protein [Spirosoma sordidisoli]
MNKRFERIADEAIVGGVCAGIAHYFGINRTVVRLIFLIGIPWPAFPAFLIYIILWIAMPKQPLGASVNQLTVYSNPVFSMNPYNPNQPASPDRSLIGGAVLIILGVLFLLDRYFNIDFGDLWPFILIAIGLWLIFKDRIKTPFDSNNTNNPNHPNTDL